jgi:hypothetical protein
VRCAYLGRTETSPPAAPLRPFARCCMRLRRGKKRDATRRRAAPRSSSHAGRRLRPRAPKPDELGLTPLRPWDWITGGRRWRRGYGQSKFVGSCNWRRAAGHTLPPPSQTRNPIHRPLRCRRLAPRTPCVPTCR